MIRALGMGATLTDTIAAPITRRKAGKVYAEIRERIIASRLRPGDRILSSREIQSQLGASYHAVTVALSRLEREGLIIRRPGSGTFVAEPGSPIPNGKAAAVKVLVTGHGVATGFVEPLVRSLKGQLAAMEAGFSFEERPDELIGALDGAGALIWVCPSLQMEMPLPKMPIVFVAQDVEHVWPVIAGYDIVTADSRQGGAIAGQYFREIGIRNVLILGAKYRYGKGETLVDSLRWDTVTEVRKEGFEAGWGEKIPDCKVLLAENHHFRMGARVVGAVLAMKPLPDGIFALSDDLAGGLCHALVAHGVEPGRDVKVVGFDGQLPRYRGDPVLTSVRVPLELLGKTAAVMGLERGANPAGVMRRVQLACDLRKGATA